jgi:hypothetical protein
MWTLALSLINKLLSAFEAWQVAKQRDLDRKAGADDLSNQISAEVLKRAKEARRIESDTNNDDWLLHPSQREKNTSPPE